MTRAVAVVLVSLAVVGTATAWSAPKPTPPGGGKPETRGPSPKPPKRALAVAPAVVKRGALVRITGRGCEGGQTVVLLSSALSTRGPGTVSSVRTTARANGSFARVVHIPVKARPGRHGVAALCGEDELGVLAWLRVR